MTSGFVDLSLIAIIALSMVMGLMRGATREVLGIAGWGGAFMTVFYGLPLCRPLGRHYIHNPMVADAVVGGVLFILSLAVFIILSRLISSGIKGSALNGLDRSLGLVFGFGRGVVLVSLFYLSLGFFYPETAFPPSVQNAHFIAWVKQGALALKYIIPASYLPDTKEPLCINDLEVLHRSTLPSLDDTVKTLSTLKPTSPLKKLDQLIEKHTP